MTTSTPGAPAGLPSTAVPVTDAPDPRRWKALSVCLVVGFMTLLDISIVNVALPSIRDGIDAGDAGLQWIVSGYALAFGLLLVPAGRIGDARGRRPIFLTGLIAFLVASTVCGLAPDERVLIIARLLQGLGGGLITPQIAGLIQELFRGPERGKAFGLFGAIIGIATAVGPVLGGVLIAVFGTDQGWRAVFFVNIPIGLVALPFAVKLIPKADPRQSRKHDYDPVGVVLLASAVTLVLLPLVEREQLSGRLQLALFAVAAAVLVGFVLWERHYGRRGKEPEVQLALFGTRSYTIGTLLGLVYFAGFTSIFFIFTLYLQQGEDYSALQAGLAITPFAIGSAATSAISGRKVSQYGQVLVTAGVALVLLGLSATLVAAHLVQGAGVGYALAVPLLIAGIGSGMVISPNQTLALSEVPVQYSGSAAGVLQTGQRVGSAVGIALVGSVFFAAVSGGEGSPAERFGNGFRTGLIVTIGLVAVTLVFAVADIIGERRKQRGEQPAAA